METQLFGKPNAIVIHQCAYVEAYIPHPMWRVRILIDIYFHIKEKPRNVDIVLLVASIK